MTTIEIINAVLEILFKWCAISLMLGAFLALCGWMSNRPVRKDADDIGENGEPKPKGDKPE